MTPLFSILTPAYNASQHLPALLESLRAQTRRDYEHLVIDDGSTDAGATVAVLRQYLDVGWTARENRGQYATQNELIRQARGKYILVIAADDMLAAADVLARVARELGGAEPDVVFGGTTVLVDGPRPYRFRPYPGGRLALASLRVLPMIQHCAVFARRAFVVENGVWFDPAYRFRGDWDWLLRLFASARSVKEVEGAIALWRHHPGQASRRYRAEAARETERLCAAHGLSYRRHVAARRLWRYYGMAAKGIGLTRAWGIGGLRDAVAEWYRRPRGDDQPGAEHHEQR